MQAPNQFNCMETLKEKAYAKINLSLNIINKRKDGYHNINSYVIFVKQSDTISIKQLKTKNKKIYVNVIGPFSKDLNNNKDINLCEKIAIYFLEKMHINDDLQITLNKKLPISSGIGGGSSDAAATLRILIKLYKINKNAFINKYSSEISQIIGADVIACFNSKTLLMEGIGEKIYKIPCRTRKIINSYKWLVLVTPNVHISTKNIFTIYKKRKEPNFNCNKGIHLDNIFRNDLKFYAEKTEYKIKEAQKSLSIQRGIIISGMSGSGPTCFGLFKDKNSAIIAKNKIKKLKPKWWIKYTSILN